MDDYMNLVKNNGQLAEDLVYIKQTQSLVDLFNEFGKFSEFEVLFESAKSSFVQFEINHVDFFKFDNKEKAHAKLHLLKNKFKNLGMKHSALILDEISAALSEGGVTNDARDQLVFRLKKSALNSFSFIYAKYIG